MPPRVRLLTPSLRRIAETCTAAVGGARADEGLSGCGDVVDVPVDGQTLAVAVRVQADLLAQVGLLHVVRLVHDWFGLEQSAEHCLGLLDVVDRGR